MPKTNKCWLMSGAHKTQSLKLNLTCLTKSSLTQQGIQNGEHVQERMICCIHWKKLDLKAGSVKRTLCRPYTTHFRRTWTHCLGTVMELEHFAWDFFSFVLSDIDLFHPAFFELLFSQKGLIQHHSFLSIVIKKCWLSYLFIYLLL